MFLGRLANFPAAMILSTLRREKRGEDKAKTSTRVNFKLIEETREKLRNIKR